MKELLFLVVRLVRRFMPFGNSATQTSCYDTGSCACLLVRDHKIGILLCYINMKLVFKLDSEGFPSLSAQKYECVFTF
jgi:hypothetical protein